MNSLSQQKKLIIYSCFVIGLLCNGLSHATEQTQRGLYLGIFGGGVASEKNDMTQSGVAYHETADDVSVQGSSESTTGAIAGSHIGYEWLDIPLGRSSSGWSLKPAVEIEGYYLGTSQKSSLSNPIAESSIRIGEHTFSDSSNLNMGVLLANSVFSIKTPWAKKVFPYVGGGIGGAITSMSNANSTQNGPTAEPGINHFNSNPNASSSSFAAQGKLGFRAEVLEHLSLFAEYRYLYVAAANYTFGSTVYSSHVPTTNWNTHYDAMNFHTGVLGIEYGF